MLPLSEIYVSPDAQNLAEEEQRYKEISRELERLWEDIPKRCAIHSDCVIYSGQSHTTGARSRSVFPSMRMESKMKIQLAQTRLALCEHRIILLKHQNNQKLGI